MAAPLVPGTVRLAKLHRIFQAAMGWTDSHLHAFTMGDQRYGMRFDHDRTVRWVGGSFDPTSFDLVSANVALQRVH